MKSEVEARLMRKVVDLYNGNDDYLSAMSAIDEIIERAGFEDQRGETYGLCSGRYYFCTISSNGKAQVVDDRTGTVIYP